MTALIRALPKPLRVSFVPAPDLRPRRAGPTGAPRGARSSTRSPGRCSGCPGSRPLDALDWARCRPTFGRPTGSTVLRAGLGRARLGALQRRHLGLRESSRTRPSARALRDSRLVGRRGAAPFEQRGVTWSRYPALVDAAGASRCGSCRAPTEQRRRWTPVFAGCCCSPPRRRSSTSPPRLDSRPACAVPEPHGSADRADGGLLRRGSTRSFPRPVDPVGRGGFDRLADVRTELHERFELLRAADVLDVGTTGTGWPTGGAATAAGLDDVRAQLDGLVSPGFVTDTGRAAAARPAALADGRGVAARPTARDPPGTPPGPRG